MRTYRPNRCGGIEAFCQPAPAFSLVRTCPCDYRGRPDYNLHPAFPLALKLHLGDRHGMAVTGMFVKLPFCTAMLRAGQLEISCAIRKGGLAGMICKEPCEMSRCTEAQHV